MESLVLRSYLSPGDMVVLTAAVRDLHRAYPGRFVTDVRTSARELWEHNPYLTPLGDVDPGVQTIDCHYPLINRSNAAPYHFLHGYAQHFEEQLGVRIPLTEFRGDIHLSAEEKRWMSRVEELGFYDRFWLVMAGGKYDFTAKWWDPAGYQAVVDHFRGRIQFVQCGEASHFHPKLDGVIDLVGQTGIRRVPCPHAAVKSGPRVGGDVAAAGRYADRSPGIHLHESLPIRTRPPLRHAHPPRRLPRIASRRCLLRHPPIPKVRTGDPFPAKGRVGSRAHEGEPHRIGRRAAGRPRQPRQPRQPSPEDQRRIEDAASQHPDARRGLRRLANSGCGPGESLDVQDRSMLGW